MGKKFLSFAFRFGLPLLGFVLLLLLSEAFKHFFSFGFDLTILIIALLVGTAWYLGRAPGVFIALVFEATLVYFALFAPNAPPQPAKKLIVYSVNRLALFLSIVVFASARRHAEQKLREQRELLQVTLKSIGDAVIATDREGRVTFINPTAENLTGWKSAEIVGKPLDEVFRVISETSRETLESPFAAVVREGWTNGLAQFTLLVTRDGAEIPIEDSGAPIRDAKGGIVGAVIVFHDVSERRRAEREREELFKSEQAARREAEVAGRLKDEFLATVSHELRTPLSAILGWASMLKNKQLKDGDAPKALEVIERNAKAQGEIINDLLDVSQITTGRLSIDRRLVELGAILETTAETLRPQAEAKSIDFTLNREGEDFFVHGDAARLRQVFSNLIANAVKFTPAGASVEVRAARCGAHIEITVSDRGIGIDEKFLPHIFEKFRQGDASPTRPHGGLGLGLSIVRHLVGLHDGQISAASGGIGKGAVFTVRLPLAENQRAATSAGGPAT
ncbi:MAG TPA: ATP-binding protein [Pyrinomonadaceae bacterium]|jgi:PAS domain S-box-containing protein